jgi:hypothetical protein
MVAVACSSKHDVPDRPEAGSDCIPPTSETCPASVPSYKTDIQPILDRRCNTSSCHVLLPDGGGQWPFDNRLDVDAWKTDIVLDLKACSMPPAGSGEFPAAERDLLWSWLMCGAPDN